MLTQANIDKGNDMSIGIENYKSEREKELENENKRLKRFAEYAFYVDGEIVRKRIPMNFSRWLDEGCPALKEKL